MDVPARVPDQMIAALCAGPGQVRLGRLAVPRPGPGEILLRLDCCGLCGTDLHKIARATHIDRVLGHELVGTVAEVGDRVSSLTAGQRVVTPHHVACGVCRRCRSGATTRCDAFRQDLLEPGGFSEFVLVREPAVRQAVRILPKNLSSEAAVFLEPGACVLRGIDRSSLESIARVGEEVSAVVLGGGSMGLLHVLLLRCLFPEAILLVSEPLDARRRQAEALGATAAVSPADLASAVASLTNDGADAAFDTVGDPALLEPTLSLLREGGSLILFAHFREGPIGAVHETLFRQEKRIIGTYSGSLDEQERLWALLASGAFQPASLVTHSLPLSQFERAIDLARTHQALKILMVAG